MLLPLPPFSMPFVGNLPANEIWKRYLASLDQTVRSDSAFPTPEVTLNNAVGQTLTTAQLLAGILLRTGPAGAFSDTTPTAALIVGAIPQADINSNRMILVRNGGGGLMTLVAGAGVTLQGTTTIASGNARFYLVTVAAKTAGLEAVNIRGLLTGAM
jgi:hypothetical protein